MRYAVMAHHRRRTRAGASAAVRPKADPAAPRPAIPRGSARNQAICPANEDGISGVAAQKPLMARDDVSQETRSVFDTAAICLYYISINVNCDAFDAVP